MITLSGDKTQQNILLVVRPAEGGIRTHIISLLRHLDRNKYTITVAAGSDFLSHLPTDLPPYSTLPIRLPSNPALSDLQSASIIANHASKGGSIIHAHGIRAGFVAAIASLLKPLKVVTSFHNLPPQSLLGRLVSWFICYRSQKVIIVSHAIAKALPTTKTHIIPNGIVTKDYHGRDMIAARKALSIAENAFVVGCVARLSREKGVDILIESAKQLPDFTFLVAGNGPEKENLQTEATPNVHLLGHIDDVRQVYFGSDMIVIPSRSEGQGIVALEAMASGVVVIATNVGGLRETITDNESGLLIEPNNPVAIIEAIYRLRDESLRSRLAENGRIWVKENRELEAMINMLDILYGRVDKK